MKVSLVIEKERELTTVIARLREMLKEGRRVHVRGDFYTPKRSLSQNSTVHDWFGEIASQSGNSKDRVKGALKQEFLPMVTDVIGNIEVRRPMSTSDLNKHQMWEFMENIQAWAIDWGYILKQPEPKILKAWRQEAEQERAA